MGNEFNQKIDIQPILDKIDNKANDISSQINNLVAEIYERVNGFYELSDDVLAQFLFEETYSEKPPSDYKVIIPLPGRGHFWLKVDVVCSDSETQAIIGYVRPGHSYETKEVNYTEKTTIAIDLAIDQTGLLKVKFGINELSGSGTATFSNLYLCGRPKTVE